MKRNILLLTAVALFLSSCFGGKKPKEDSGDPQGFDSNGASLALFSVSPDRQVRFSRGNLQYQASTATWRFAERQYSYIGEDNEKISSKYDGWIDLFGWGTSGWHGSGANAYMPYHNSTDYKDYYIGEHNDNNLTDLTGEYAKADWGVNNAISNGGNKPGLWRTLTNEEWNYLLFERNGARIDMDEKSIVARFAKAQVCGVNGLIVFPDEFTRPEGVSSLKNVSDSRADFTSNVLPVTEWHKYENTGCIFLPAGGNRNGADVCNIGTFGNYWSSTDGPECYAWGIYFDGDYARMSFDSRRYYGLSVRLVQDAN